MGFLPPIPANVRRRRDGRAKAAKAKITSLRSLIEHLKDERYGKQDVPDMKLNVDDMQELVERFKKLIKDRTGKAFPQDAHGTALGRDRRSLWLLDE